MMLPFPTEKYNVITADPPWPLVRMHRKQARPNQPKVLDYPTMSIEEIAALPVGSLAQDDCVLFCWTVQKYLKEALDIVDGWGFKYRGLLSWSKTSGMCIQGIHWNVEHFIFAYRGSLEKFPKRPAMPALITEKSRQHSRKPAVFYQWAEVFGDKRIDLFSRQDRPNWDHWGNDTGMF